MIPLLEYMETKRVIAQQSDVIVKQGELIEALVKQVKNLGDMCEHQTRVTDILTKYCDELKAWCQDNSNATIELLNTLNKR